MFATGPTHRVSPAGSADAAGALLVAYTIAARRVRELEHATGSKKRLRLPPLPPAQVTVVIMGEPPR